MPPDPLALHAYACIINTPDLHVTPFLKILATGLAIHYQGKLAEATIVSFLDRIFR